MKRLDWLFLVFCGALVAIMVPLYLDGWEPHPSRGQLAVVFMACFGFAAAVLLPLLARKEGEP